MCKRRHKDPSCVRAPSVGLVIVVPHYIGVVAIFKRKTPRLIVILLVQIQYVERNRKLNSVMYDLTFDK